MIYKLITLFTIYIILDHDHICAETDPSQAKLVFMIHRHGDRTPIQCYPTDPYRNASYWEDGWGQLTPRGKDRMYRLGQYIRQRYHQLLGSSPREVHIRSSGADRCLESAALVLAGAYTPDGRWQWDQDLGKVWQPFPIQTEPRHLDGLLNPGSKCVSAEEEMKRIHDSSEVKEYTKQKKGILDYVSKNSGRTVADLNSAEEIFDSLHIERENGYSLPRWVDDNTFDSLKAISDMTFYFDFSTKLIQRLRTGLLLKDIIFHIKEHLNQNQTNPSSDTSNKKLHIYSTHDTQVALMLNALNVFDKKSPPFGSTLLIELNETKGEDLLQFYYLKDTESEKPIPLVLPNCANDKNECHFTQFVQSVNDLMPNDWEQECHNRDESFDTNTVIHYLFGSLITLSVMTLLYVLYIFFRPKNKEISYQMLPMMR